MHAGPPASAAPEAPPTPAAVNAQPAVAAPAASAPTSPANVASPRAAVKIDWSQAVLACEAAVAAELGEPHFQFALGKAYFYVKNYLEAARHLTIAANAGIADAQNGLGYCYNYGLGVVKNDQKAFELYSKAAEGSALGMASLGVMYTNGSYVKQDFGNALDWYEKSIEAGNADALAQTANMYFNGHGVQKDYAMAAQYFIFTGGRSRRRLRVQIRL